MECREKLIEVTLKKCVRAGRIKNSSFKANTVFNRHVFSFLQHYVRVRINIVFLQIFVLKPTTNIKIQNMAFYFNKKLFIKINIFF